MSRFYSRGRRRPRVTVVAILLVCGVLSANVSVSTDDQTRKSESVAITAAGVLKRPFLTDEADTRSSLPVIDGDTPEKDLLPPPAKNEIVAPQYEDLTKVPEVQLEEPIRGAPGNPLPGNPLLARIADIELLNRRESDGFIKALIRNRPDLAGLPFLES